MNFRYRFFIVATVALIGIRPVHGQWVQTNGPSDVSMTHSLSSVGNTVFAGTWGQGTYKTTDYGDTWIACDSISSVWGVSALASLAGPGGAVTLYSGIPGVGIRRSSDHGYTWQTVNSHPGPLSFTVVPFGTDSTWLYAGLSGGGVLRTSDYGSTWHAMNNGLPDLPLVFSLTSCADTDGYRHLLAGTKYGVYRSSDDGHTWSKCFGVPDVQVHALASTTTEQGSISIFAGTHLSGVFRSNDFGVTWESVNIGIDNLLILELHSITDKSGKTVLFAGAQATVYISLDNGEHWTDIRQNMPTSGILAITFVPDTPHGILVFAGSGSVWRRPLAEMLPVPVEQPESPASLALHQNFPNPVSSATGSGMTQIGYEIDKPGYVTLSVCNVLGTSRVVLVEDYKSTGTHTTQFDASGLPPGVYIYRLVVGNWRLQKKLLIID